MIRKNRINNYKNKENIQYRDCTLLHYIKSVELFPSWKPGYLIYLMYQVYRHLFILYIYIMIVCKYKADSDTLISE